MGDDTRLQINEDKRRILNKFDWKVSHLKPFLKLVI